MRRRRTAVDIERGGGSVDTVLVAEGIEEPHEVDTLQALGVQVGQGFLLGRPGPIADLA
jgi:EAL domain-containing protein (putative c-di-GMP-specific phosphodiesterase class I)